jgi:hypothetical protein
LRRCDRWVPMNCKAWDFMICYRNLSNLTMTIFSQRRIASSKATTLSTTNMRWHCNVPFLPFRRINESQFSTLVLVEDSWFTVPWMPAKKLIGQSTFTQLRRILIQFNPSNGGYRKTSGRTMFRLLKQTWSYGSPASKRTFSCRSYWVDLVITSWVLSGLTTPIKGHNLHTAKILSVMFTYQFVLYLPKAEGTRQGEVLCG